MIEKICPGGPGMEAVFNFLGEQFSKMIPVITAAPPWLSVPAAMTICIVIGILAIMPFMPKEFWRRPEAPPSDKSRSGESGSLTVESLQGDIRRLREEIEKKEKDFTQIYDNPPFSSLEIIYFKLNGIVNASLILSICLFVYEYFTIRKQLDKLARERGVNAFFTQSKNLIEQEIATILVTVGASIFLSCIIVSMAHGIGGRSIEIINRSFKISLVVCSVAFVLFVFFVSPR
jgi:hypothetical protein